MSYKVTTGPNAYSFHDQSTGINISRGEIKELTPAQYSKPRIKRALLSGHLQAVMDPKEPVRYTKGDIKKLDKKLRDLFNNGIDATKAAKSFTLEDLKVVANFNGLEPESGDTNVTLVEDIYGVYGSEKGEE